MSLRFNLEEALQGKRLLIFDFDGTLVDTSPLHAAAFSKVLAPFDIMVDYASIAGMKTRDAMQRLLMDAKVTLNEAKIARLAIEKQLCVRHLISQGLQPMAGVDDFLRWARQYYKLAMVTSGSKETVSLALKQIGYTGWFDPLICAEDVTVAKPSPEGYLMALKMTDMKASDALVFEDSEAGFASATEANIDYINVNELSWSLETKALI